MRTSIVLALVCACPVSAEVVQRRAMSTLSAVELNHGDSIQFTLVSGETRTLTIIDSWTQILLTDLAETHHGRFGGGTVYSFGCTVDVDGQQMKMLRYVPVQASFYEPYVVNGMRIWFDGVRAIGQHFNESHGDCVPRKDVRLAIQDAKLPICPEEIRPWYPSAVNRIDIHACYNGDDVWMGPYFGADLHGGLDINMPIGTPLWAPIRFDDHYYFNSLKLGHNNNRWRGIRRWDNDQRWVLQAHHVAKLLAPPRVPIAQNEHYAVAAGELTGSHAHSHFVFKVGEEDDEILLDAWILFWQIFENNRHRAGSIRAAMDSLAPSITGESVIFDAADSRPGVTGNAPGYRWTFGDGGCSGERNPTHVFTRPGVYPVTLVVDDGVFLDSTTQHVTVNGDAIESPVLSLDAPDEIEFVHRPAHVMDTYGDSPRFLPHTLRFTARHGTSPVAKRIEVHNTGAGILKEVSVTTQFLDVSGWLHIEQEGEGNNQTLSVRVDANKLKQRHGVYQAVVQVDCPDSINSPQSFGVQLTTPVGPPATDIVIDNDSDACHPDSYFWHAPRFHGADWPKGYGETYLISGDRSVTDGSIRYQPDLADGTYEVLLHEETPVRPTPQTDPRVRFPVRVRHSTGTKVVWVEPVKSRVIGTFHFDRGTHGFVQLETLGAEGLVVADAIRYRRLEDE